MCLYVANRNKFSEAKMKKQREWGEQKKSAYLTLFSSGVLNFS